MVLSMPEEESGVALSNFGWEGEAMLHSNDVARENDGREGWVRAGPAVKRTFLVNTTTSQAHRISAS